MIDRTIPIASTWFAIPKAEEPPQRQGTSVDRNATLTFHFVTVQKEGVFRWLGSLLMLLVASSLVMTATLHAHGTVERIVADCSGAIHTDGDGDKSQGDSDSAVPHHHVTGHCHLLAVPISDGVASSMRPTGMIPTANADEVLVSHLVEPGLRPPLA